MNWCEGHDVDYVFGLARNQRLRKIIGRQMWEATEQWNGTGKPARVFAEFGYQTRKAKNRGWDRERRVVAKAEHIDGKENPRFVVTSLSGEPWAAQALYEELYCARGDMENRIKEQFSLFADRVSAETMRANQLRLYFSVMAYVLVSGLRRLGLRATELAQAQVSTIRTKLLKIGAQVRISVRQGLDIDGLQLSVAERLPAGLVESALLTHHRVQSDFLRTPSARTEGFGQVRLYGPAETADAIARHEIDPRYSRQTTAHFFARSIYVVTRTFPLPFGRSSHPS